MPPREPLFLPSRSNSPDEFYGRPLGEFQSSLAPAPLLPSPIEAKASTSAATGRLGPPVTIKAPRIPSTLGKPPSHRVASDAIPPRPQTPRTNRVASDQARYGALFVPKSPSKPPRTPSTPRRSLPREGYKSAAHAIPPRLQTPRTNRVASDPARYGALFVPKSPSKPPRTPSTPRRSLPREGYKSAAPSHPGSPNFQHQPIELTKYGPTDLISPATGRRLSHTLNPKVEPKVALMDYREMAMIISNPTTPVTPRRKRVLSSATQSETPPPPISRKPLIASPGKPPGTCQYCGTHFRDADHKRDHLKNRKTGFCSTLRKSQKAQH